MHNITIDSKLSHVQTDDDHKFPKIIYNLEYVELTETLCLTPIPFIFISNN